MNLRFHGLLLVSAVSLPLSCSSDDKPSALGSGATSGSSGSSSRSGSSSGDPGGESSVGATSAGGASAGFPGGEIGGEGLYDGGGGEPPNPATVCVRDAEWETTPLAGVNTPADERLLAMTPDELTLVFARDDELFVLDDGEESPVALPLGYTHERGVSLTADGLSLIVVAEGGLGFAEVSRASRGAPFAVAPSLARFAYLNDARVTSGDLFAAPALSADGQTLYYTVRRGLTVANVRRARGPQLSEIKLQDPVTLGTEDGNAKLVVSVSADERTLFVLDEALGHVMGLWSATPAAEFGDPVPFEGFQSVFTNVACDRIYGTIEIDGSLDIVSGSPK